MPKIKNLAALAAAIEAARRYARSNPDKAAKYLDQAAAFLDKQTKGKYSSKIDGVAKQVKSAAGLPASSGQGTQSYVANAGYGRHEGYGASTVAPDPLTTTAPSTTPPSAGSTGTSSTAASTTPSPTPPSSLPPTSATTDPTRTGDRSFPGSKDL